MAAACMRIQIALCARDLRPGMAVAHAADARPELARQWNRVEGATGALNVTAHFAQHQTSSPAEAAAQP